MPCDSLWWLLFVILNFLDLLFLSSSIQEDFWTVSLRDFLSPIIGDDRGGGSEEADYFSLSSFPLSSPSDWT